MKCASPSQVPRAKHASLASRHGTHLATFYHEKVAERARGGAIEIPLSLAFRPFPSVNATSPPQARSELLYGASAQVQLRGLSPQKYSAKRTRSLQPEAISLEGPYFRSLLRSKTLPPIAPSQAPPPPAAPAPAPPPVPQPAARAEAEAEAGAGAGGEVGAGGEGPVRGFGPVSRKPTSSRKSQIHWDFGAFTR